MAALLNMVLLLQSAAASKTRTYQPLVPPADEAAVTVNQFLIISSPTLGRVAWTLLSNFHSKQGRPFALIATGLQQPVGLAFDRRQGFLYVADKAAKAIYRYLVIVETASGSPSLIITGERLTIQAGHPVEWLTVDDEGNLFYTAPDTNNINKLTKDVIDRIERGETNAEKLKIISEKTLEAQSAVQSSLASTAELPTAQDSILSIYESKVNHLVEKPAGVWADGDDLYWTNTHNGKATGTIVKGEVNPKPVKNGTSGPAPFPAKAITKYSSDAFGLAKAKHIMFFSHNGSMPSHGLVSAMLMSTGDVVPAVQNLNAPMGLAFDGEHTLYVADVEGGIVYSFPTGRFMADVPLTKAVKMEGACGLSLLSETDPCFTKRKTDIKVHEESHDASIQEKIDEIEEAESLQDRPSLSFLQQDSASFRHRLRMSGILSVWCMAALRSIICL